MAQTIKIGTRGSPLALVQTEMIRAALSVVAPEIDTEIVIIKTSGDWKPADGEVRLNTDAGGKGQFAKEIEEALLAGVIDCAMHSMKDMETRLPEGLIIPCVLPREDVRDVLLFRDGLREIKSIDDLPEDATIGTASVRRQAFLLARRPDLNIVPFRGNVQTRIDKLRAGQVDATMLALAGLKRLDLEHEADLILDVEQMLPAAAQGAVGVEMRESRDDLLSLFGQINCQKTLLCVTAERAALAALDGSCHTPVGALAKLENKRMFLKVEIATLDGAQIYSDEQAQEIETLAQAEALGLALGEALKTQMPQDILEQRAEG